MKSFGSLCLGLGALTVSSCATYTDLPLDPAHEMEQLREIRLDAVKIEYAGASSRGVDAALLFDPSDGFDEAELAAVALTLNPTLRAKRESIGEAQALLISAGVLPNPDLGAFIRPAIGDSSGTSWGLDVLFGLLRPDERPARRAVAEAQVEIVRAEIAEDELHLVSDLRRTRIAVLAAEQSARLFEAELTLRDNAVALVRQQRELGEATEIATTLVELERMTVQRQYRDAAAMVETKQRSLRALLGVPPTADIRLVGSGTDLAFTIVEDLSDAEIDKRLLAGRVELRTREAEYRMAEQALRLAIAKQFPSIGIGPSYEKDIEGSEGLGIGASIELPLFDRNQGDIAAQLATRDRKRAEYVATLQELRVRAFEARAELRRTRTDIDLQQTEVLPLVQRAESLFEAAFRARELSIFEWMTARTRAIQARRDLLDALTRYASAAVELDAVTGAPFVTVMNETSVDEAQR